MRIYFITREPDVCQLIADKFLDFNAEIKIFPSMPNLLETIFEFNQDPDILFFDYLYFDLDKNDPYDFLIKQNKMFPIVYYNHPFPNPNRRKFYWRFNLEKTSYFKDLSTIEPLLDRMEEALKDPNIAPYVSAIQKEKPYRSTNLRYIVPLKEHEIKYYTENFSNVITDSIKSKNLKFEENNNKLKSNSSKSENQDFKNSINQKISPEAENFAQSDEFSQNEIQEITAFEFVNQFRLEHHMSHEIYSLFEHLYAKLNVHVTILELLNILKLAEKHQSEEISKEHTKNSLRIAIFRLRKIILEDKNCNLNLISFDHGYMLTNKPPLKN